MSVSIAKVSSYAFEYSPHPLTNTRLATCTAERLLRRPLWGPAEGLPFDCCDENCENGVNDDGCDGDDDRDDAHGGSRESPACLTLTVWTTAMTRIRLLLKMLSLLLPMPRVPAEERGIHQVHLTIRDVGLLLAWTL